MSADDPAAATRAHVERFNDGVRSGNFTAMTDRFAADAELVFTGVPVGPFRGRPAKSSCRLFAST